MEIDKNTLATMLCTVTLGRADRAPPLTALQWHSLATWLTKQDREPSNLLDGEARWILADWQKSELYVKKSLQVLLDRHAAMEEAIARWQNAGLTILARDGEWYPKRLNDRLKHKAPPVLFACGNFELLDKGGLAVVGSRGASTVDLEFACALGRRAAEEDFVLVSGGARGVDQYAMRGALEARGEVAGVLPVDIGKAPNRSGYREYLEEDRLVLVSPNSPEAGWAPGLAMGRNRYIYCLSDASVVVASAQGRGGTWGGAKENLRKNWTPLWVRRSDTRGSGNDDLVRTGGSWLPDPMESVGELFPTTVKTCITYDSDSRRDQMNMNANSEATLLCTAQFGDFSGNGAAPLSATEWGDFAEWLFKRGMSPASLLDARQLELKQLSSQSPIDSERLHSLLSRGVEMALAREAWQRQGLWTVTRAETDYPRSVKRKFGKHCPPVLFGCGEKELLQQRGLAVIGSLRAETAGEALSAAMIDYALQEGLPLIADHSPVAETRVLDAVVSGGGVGILVRSHGLLDAALSAVYRDHLMAGSLLLLSERDPKTPMRRDATLRAWPLVYSLAIASVTVDQLRHSPGEAVKHEVPIRLVQQDHLADTTGDRELDNEQAQALTRARMPDHGEQAAGLAADSQDSAGVPEPRAPVHSAPEAAIADPVAPPTQDFYQFFLAGLADMASEELSAKEIAGRLDVAIGQVNKWLKHGVSVGDVTRKTRPIRFSRTIQLTLPFDPMDNED